MSTANEFTRQAPGGGTVTAADANMSSGNIPRVACVGATRARIGAEADTDAVTLKGRWVFFDASDNVIGVTPQYTFTAGTGVFAGSGEALPSARLATPDRDTLIDPGGAYSLIFLIDAVSAPSNWQLCGRLFFPDQVQ